ncbi:MFS transporter [Bordetella genomosp. 7]|jgi:MFS family permease|uniref:MFS transporter n=1 Tax=Bordetella genomosp. 7 TaxID=1416805 RepID=A0A261QY92_9BORD|nr:MFS transporter [Bordetella genomosp. 7]OZI17706.1 MFS transporter [Bordetella genomosp. 7]OZI22217.1 MFS transporter [Bordetella genomosp. 7]
MSWFSELPPTGKRTFYASFLGWTIDALDYMVFTFVISTLVTLWGIDRGQAGMLGTVTLLFSAIGGWGAGILADRYGRVRILQITILWFSACTVAIGFTQNFEQIFILRALQGLGFGGEWAVGSVLMGEIIKSRHRARAVGTVQSGWAVGWGLAALLYTIAFSVLPEQWAWRSLFWVGVLPALLVLYIRKHVPEPEIAGRVRGTKSADHPKVSPWLIFSPALLKTTLLSALLCTGIQGGYYAVTTWLPTYLKVERQLSVLNTGGYLLVIIVGSFCGYIAGAHMADRLGRRLNFVIFSVLSGVCVYFYTQVPLTDSQMLFLGFPLGFAASGIFGGLGAYLTELFPTEIRANGQGFAYNFGRGVGALFPTLVGYLSNSLGLAMAIGIFAGGAYAVVLLATLLLPETRGRELSTLSDLS